MLGIVGKEVGTEGGAAQIEARQPVPPVITDVQAERECTIRRDTGGQILIAGRHSGPIDAADGEVEDVAEHTNPPVILMRVVSA